MLKSSAGTSRVNTQVVTEYLSSYLLMKSACHTSFQMCVRARALARRQFVPRIVCPEALIHNVGLGQKPSHFYNLPFKNYYYFICKFYLIISQV